MKKCRVLVSSLIVTGLGAFAPNLAYAFESGAESDLVHAYSDELSQIRRSEELERKAIRVRDQIEAKRAEIERQINSHRVKADTFRAKSDSLESEMKESSTSLEALQTELANAESEYNSFRQLSEEKLAFSESARKNLDETNKRLEESRDRLRATREAMTRALYANKSEIQRLRTESTYVESRIDSLETEVANVGSEEAKTRAEIAALRKEIAEKNAVVLEKMAALNEVKKQNDAAQNALKIAKADFDKAERDKLDAEKKIMSDIRGYEEATFMAQRNKSTYEAEKFRMEAELDKLKSYASNFKLMNDQAQESSAASQKSLFEARLALQTMKADLMQGIAQVEKVNLQKEQATYQARQIASVIKTEEATNGLRSWVANKRCSLRTRASSKSDEVPSSEVNAGQKLLGRDYSQYWVKVNGGFIRKDCGSFE